VKARSYLFAWIALAACGGASKPSTQQQQPPPPDPQVAPAPPQPPAEPPPAPEIPCLQAVDALFAVTAVKARPELRARSSKVFVQRCEEDRWSAEVKGCMLVVKAPEDADRCEGMQTPEQRRALARELARELDAAGVPARTESGKSKPAAAQPAAPDARLAPAPKGGAKKTAPKATKAKQQMPSAGRAADPCEGGE
jgi:hypothetical protein